jgi:hypothetical protein
METVHGKWNLNWQLADTPYYVVEYPDGFVIESLGDSAKATMIPIRLVEDNSCCYFCKENEQLYSQQDINYFFYSDQYSILPINTTPAIMNAFGNEMMAEEMEEEFDIMDMIL